jgi:L,D-transpeptidase ErfK/SrfK
VNTFKNLLAILALVGVGYWVYVSINGRPLTHVDGEDSLEPLSSAPKAGSPEDLAARRASDPRKSGFPLAGKTIPLTTEPPSSELDPTGIEQTGLVDEEEGLATAMARIQEKLDQNQLTAALRMLTEWYDDPRLSPEQNDQVTDLLDQLAGTVIYSKQHLLVEAHVVQPGDTLEGIAKTYKISWQLLAKINGLSDPRQMRPGDRLKVVPGPFGALVDVEKFRLTLVVQDMYAGRFLIGTGRENSTPRGTFPVLKKVVNPSWPSPRGEVPHGDPANPLGGRWIDLGGGIGIHGTNDPASIGKSLSEGCVRLAPRDIEDVFDILTEGSRVTIVGGSLPTVVGRAGPPAMR